MVGGLLVEVRNLIKSDVLPLDLHLNYGRSFAIIAL
jgi:hypothetical protein